MLTYAELKNKPKEFLAATGLKVDEVERLLPGWCAKLAGLSPPELTKRGQPRQRRAGAGPKEKLATPEDKLLFILVYHKTYPLQTMLGLQFGLSQSRANYWIHVLLPVLHEVLTEQGLTPARDASALAEHPLMSGTTPDLLIDGTERRRQRPGEEQAQRDAYSGKKKAHTDKNLVLVNTETKQVVYLSPTAPGKTHDKKLADQQGLVYPANATLGKDTGFQGYEPAGVLTFQPKKSRKAKP
jgi:hypothetical protein